MDCDVRRLAANFASLRLPKSLKLHLVRKHILLISIGMELCRSLRHGVIQLQSRRYVTGTYLLAALIRQCS